MVRLSSGMVVLVLLVSLPASTLAQSSTTALQPAPSPLGATAPLAGLTCSPAELNPESYRLVTDAQALNLTRPRSDWWDGFDATLGAQRNALGDLNDAALIIAEGALALDARNLAAHAQIARQLVVLGENGDRARAEFRTVFEAGGAVVWTATLYDVDARDYFLMAFDRRGIRVFRFAQAAGAVARRFGIPEFPGPEARGLWRALGGCLEGLSPEAEVPWTDVYEIKAGHFVVYFKFNTPVRVSSDRGKRRTLREFKVALHGGMGTVEYLVSPGSTPWSEPSVRGIEIGPTAYQDRVRRTLVAVVDPDTRITLPKVGRGAGW